MFCVLKYKHGKKTYIPSFDKNSVWKLLISTLVVNVPSVMNKYWLNFLKFPRSWLLTHRSHCIFPLNHPLPLTVNWYTGIHRVSNRYSVACNCAELRAIVRSLQDSQLRASKIHLRMETLDIQGTKKRNRQSRKGIESDF